MAEDVNLLPLEKRRLVRVVEGVPIESGESVYTERRSMVEYRLVGTTGLGESVYTAGIIIC
jgi:hypothetical protein